MLMKDRCLQLMKDRCLQILCWGYVKFVFFFVTNVKLIFFASIKNIGSSHNTHGNAESGVFLRQLLVLYAYFSCWGF